MSRLESLIARLSCPVAVGEILEVRDGRKHYKGKVDGIASTYEAVLDEIHPRVDAYVGFSMFGRRIRKTDGKIGKWRFSVNSFDFKLIDGVWVRTKYRDPIEYLAR